MSSSRWRLSRRHDEAEKLLGENYRGLLQSDGYEAYAAYVRARPEVEWLGCWAHARRRFFEAAGERPRTAERVLRLIGQLYQLEHEWDETEVGAQRAALRRKYFARPLARLHRLVSALQKRVLPKSGLGQACAYLLGHWAPLTAHLRHSQTRLDTNAVENAIRPSKLGAKNWLFVGHPDAGDRAAVIYSLVVSCPRHGHDPHAYLRDVLTRLPAMTTKDDLRPLLPAHWKPEHDCARIIVTVITAFALPASELPYLPPRQEALRATLTEDWRCVPSARDRRADVLSMEEAV